ncbi:hypothetical protein L210DRAFT_3650038 [Boletus edulis BED1]|uniref:G domain-containing protein n=1 Tax=Boletus edulis BED1 TaxID=1328754 RepID=A0AAD4BKE3_BOLED|nr:hypothetical protein L210DRAFT_3650038 [Boletus edulis BED1]
MSNINIILFGETGVGKSSVINLIARQDVAATSYGTDILTFPSARKWVDDTRPLSSRPSISPTITDFPPQTASSEIAQLSHSAHPPVSQPVPQREQSTRFNVNGTARSYAYGSASRSHDNKGWTEYTHPDGVHYYVNEDNRAITDFDLRSLTKLDEVSNTINAFDDAPEGCEMWIRAGSNVKKGWCKQKAGGDPAVFWVDHRHRRVLSEAPSGDYVQSGVDDRLDDEHRYWAFIEMHPAHIPRGIVESARKDAIDVLHWSYTDHLLTHPHLPPFSQDECRELIKLLNGPNYPIIPAYTWTVARILLRVARWRQVNFRPSARKWVDDVPRPTSFFGLGGEHDTVASMDRPFGTNSAVLGSLGQAIPLDSKTDTTNVPEGAGPPSFSLGSRITTPISYGSASTQTYPLLSLLSPDFISDHNILRDVTAKDPEALLDTQNFNVADASQTDTSIIATALITALGLLTSHSSNPKVAVFQLSAAAVSFTLIALHSFHSKTLADTKQHSRELTLVQRLLKYFPPFIFASCWILFLLSITFTFPKPMSVAVCLVVFASIPMVCGARLPAALTLAVITLFTLTFFTLVFLVCVLPTEWLV